MPIHPDWATDRLRAQGEGRTEAQLLGDLHPSSRSRSIPRRLPEQQHEAGPTDGNKNQAGASAPGSGAQILSKGRTNSEGNFSYICAQLALTGKMLPGMAPIRGEIKGNLCFYFFAIPFDVIHDRGLLTAAEQLCCMLMLSEMLFYFFFNTREHMSY